MYLVPMFSSFVGFKEAVTYITVEGLALEVGDATFNTDLLIASAGAFLQQENTRSGLQFKSNTLNI